MTSDHAPPMRSRLIFDLIVVGLVVASCTGCMMSQRAWKNFKGHDTLNLRVKLVDPSMPSPTFEWLETMGHSGTIELAPPLPGCDRVTAYLSVSEKESVAVEAGKGDVEYENWLRTSYPDDPSYQEEFEAIPEARCGILLTMHAVDEAHRRLTEIHAATVNGHFYAAEIDRSPRPEYLALLPLTAVGDVITAPIQGAFLLFMMGWSH